MDRSSVERYSSPNVRPTTRQTTFRVNKMDEWQVGKSVIEASNYMLRYGIACDVTFLVGDTREEIRAHKYVLMSRSKVLLQVLSEHLDNADITVSVEDVNVETFRDMLTYLYTEHIDIHASNVTSTLYAARKFSIKGLTAVCFKYLDSEMCNGNVCKIFEQTHIYEETSLYDKCIKFILENGNDVLKTHAFFDLCAECVSTILKSDDLKADEYLIFEAMMMWSTNECRRQKLPPSDENRRKVLGPILYLIRFPTMDVVCFTQKISFRDILSNDEAVSIFQFFHGEERPLSTKFNTNERNRLMNKKPLTDKKRSQNNKNKGQRRETVRVTPTKRVVDTPMITLPAPLSPNMSKVCRFRTYDGQWKQNGPPDAISFSCSSPIVLYGIEVYGPTKCAETCNIKLYLYDDLKEEVRTNNVTITTDVIRKTYDVMFARPIRIPPRRIFTVMIILKGSSAVKGVEGSTVHVVDGVTFEFSNSNRSSNGTDITVGQIPNLLFNKTE